MNKQGTKKGGKKENPQAKNSSMGGKRNEKRKGRKEQPFLTVQNLPSLKNAAAVAYARPMRTPNPEIRQIRDQKRIVHRELLGSVTGSTLFAIANTIALNPGLPGSFPWLSNESLGWECYHFNRLRFEFITRTGSTTPGSVMLLVDYDSSDMPPVSEQVASSYTGTQEDAPWKDITINLQPSAMGSLGPRKFLRAGANPANTDIKTYDSGTFFVATVDGTAIPWGKLWVEYDVTFYTPQLISNTIFAAAIKGSSTSPATANTFGGPSAVLVGNTNMAVIAGNTITFPTPGQYLLSYGAVAGAIVFNSIAITAAAGNAVGGYYDQSAATFITAWYRIDVGTPGAVVTYNLTYTSGTSLQFYLTALPSSTTF